MNPQPKPAPGARAAKKRERERLARQMLDAVWARDRGLCRLCLRLVSRWGCWPAFGEVHHLKGRRVRPEAIHDPERSVLLCHDCHRDVTEKRIAVEGETSPTFRMVEKTRGHAL